MVGRATADKAMVDLPPAPGEEDKDRRLHHLNHLNHRDHHHPRLHRREANRAGSRVKRDKQPG